MFDRQGEVVAASTGTAMGGSSVIRYCYIFVILWALYIVLAVLSLSKRRTSTSSLPSTAPVLSRIARATEWSSSPEANVRGAARVVVMRQKTDAGVFQACFAHFDTDAHFSIVQERVPVSSQAEYVAIGASESQELTVFAYLLGVMSRRLHNSLGLFLVRLDEDTGRSFAQRGAFRIHHLAASFSDLRG